MIAWYWLIPAFFIGGYLGVLLMCLMAISKGGIHHEQ